MSRSGSIPKGAGSKTFQAGLKVIVERTKSQHDKFREAARALGCDEDPARFDEALKKVARHKPAKDGGKAEKPKDQENAKRD